MCLSPEISVRFLSPEVSSLIRSVTVRSQLNTPLISDNDETDLTSYRAQNFNHSKALHFACDEDFNQIQKSIKDCKKKTEEAYSDESTGDDDIERLQKELDEDMELKSKTNDELR
ncbi:unnamed protein product [Brassica rapa]|uniref:Uncharacterized protein n=1 Tax=Brassica campestris TaxID=3711 RepID=A0A3P6AYD1_BRACM|nr:unnamed protein product [Brassica rapa]VDC96067.1 unnamed protein product [Brassica rapa]